ncbi:MAG: hypothetical protein ABH807_02985 [Candidatus Shapirobacteria bacterium]
MAKEKKGEKKIVKKKAVIKKKPPVKEKIKKEAAPKKIKKIRGKRYLAAKKLLEPKKLYPLNEAIKLLRKISISSFNASIDLHLTMKEAGIQGEVELPHPTGKNTVIALADEATLKKIAKNKIDFTGLVATPAQMTNLVKYAKILGPKGLMPNPKNGTISEKPEETAKKLAGKTKYHSEAKAPLIHVTIGKVQDSEKALEKNLAALMAAIGRGNILKAVLSPTMGPGIKIDLNKIDSDKL